MKLNLGCGKNILENWINLDRAQIPGVDIICDLENCTPGHIPLGDNTIEEIYVAHVLEHITHILPLMQELYRIAKPDATMVIKVPHGASDGAWEDPTHVRAFFPQSFRYFGQPFYWLADYGYRGDWKVEKIEILLPDSYLRNEAYSEIENAIARERNIAKGITAILKAIKPMREPKAELQETAPIDYLFAFPA